MKEITYGWYPSVNDIYQPKNRPSSYHLECLYKYGDSLYYQGQVAPPQPELFVRGVASTPPATPDVLRRKARSVPVPKFSTVPKLHIPTPTQCWSTHKTLPAETQWGLTEDLNPQPPTPSSEVNWPLPKGKSQQQQRQQHQRFLQHKHQQQQQLKQHIQQQQEKYYAERHQTPQSAWGVRKSSRDPSPPRSDASTGDLAWPVANRHVAVRPKSSYDGQFSARQKQQQQVGQKQRPVSSPVKSSGQRVLKPGVVPTPPAGRSPSPTKKHVRIQSATVRREKTPLPTRPVTAGPGRQSAQEQELQAAYYEAFGKPSRPVAPVPFVYDVNDMAGDLEDADEIMPRSPSPVEDDYETILNKYGWRAEVHGDPYGLKKPMKRQSYFVTCSEPDLLPEPPNVHMETNEPFFLNTIPHRPMSFAVDKEWMSEVLLAKRLELQKREGGIKYNYKNFAFVY